MSHLTSIANAFGTDKGTVKGEGHAYTCVYEVLFAPLHDRPINLLEIGLAVGGPELGNSPDRKVTDAPSLRMWREYFPKAHIYGLDISDFSAFQSDWFTFFQVDCGNAERLAEFARSGVECDIIIDDGSHASYHQQLTFCHLFPMLKSGGVYIIEDLGWQPKEYEEALPRVPKTVKLFASFLQDGRFSNTGAISEMDWQSITAQIGTVLLFSEDYILDLRRFFNKRAKLVPSTPHYLDRPTIGARGQFKRLIEGIISLATTAAAQIGPRQYRRVKLAVVQKL